MIIVRAMIDLKCNLPKPVKKPLPFAEIVAI